MEAAPVFKTDIKRDSNLTLENYQDGARLTFRVPIWLLEGFSDSGPSWFQFQQFRAHRVEGLGFRDSDSCYFSGFQILGQPE